MSAEIWTLRPNAGRFDRRMKIALGRPVRMGDIGLLLLRDRHADGSVSAIRMQWHRVGADQVTECELRPFRLGEFGAWTPAAVSDAGTVLFNIVAPHWPLMVPSAVSA